ncbi:hypothetical protein VPBG_00135 [Vibrio phage helene 12B3]|nr:hypothetical protein VPBG_00135 [Vibrio phage helene 12B3]AGG57907.1 hypothetical protein VPBG_00135 [Vibrio phage helene 12B3]
MNKVKMFFDKGKVLWNKVKCRWKYAPRWVRVLDISCWVSLIVFLLVVL